MYTKEQIRTEIIEAVKKVKETNPMAGSITNSVTIKRCENRACVFNKLKHSSR